MIRLANNTTHAVNQRNVNTNKVRLNTLNNQLATEKKITNPSDDPIIATNSLRYRAELTKIEQYFERNTEDANAWISATSNAAASVVDLLTNAKTLITTGATGTSTNESRKAIIEELKGVVSQIYENGNTSYAGRYVFTGSRTATGLTFLPEDELKAEYKNITEKLTPRDIDIVTYVKGKTTVVDDAATEKAKTNGDETKVDNHTPYRMRLAYNKLDDTPPTVMVGGAPVNVQTMSLYSTNIDDAYDDSKIGGDDAVFIPETGELILGRNLANKLLAMKPDEECLTVSYDKSQWELGDIRPENYFECSLKGIFYREQNQPIIYDVSNTQKIQINSYASQMFFHSIGRDIEELANSLNDVVSADGKVKKLEKMLTDESLTAAERNNLTKSLDASKKELDLVNEKLQRMFEGCEEKFSKYHEKAVFTETEVGTKGQRLELIQNRLMTLQGTTEAFADDNENVEITDVAVKINEAKTMYGAALSAMGKITGLNLLSYL